ncbi:MAG: transcriptional regulator, PadR family [Anaerocolumna sp.]|jgi:DNA-binding PadR family transcriptional regulator|nr:transcriptional regulator, PadR family [Anaerocolumna sp.]
MRDNVKGGALTEVTFFILLALYEPKHGYGIMQFVEKETGGRLNLGAGSLYGAINSLQEKRWISPVNDSDSDGTVRKKEYMITEAGKKVAESELIRLKQLIITASNIMKGEEK